MTKSPIRRLIRAYFLEHWKAGVVIALLIVTAQLSALVEPVILRRVVDVVIPAGDLRMLLILAGSAIGVRLVATGILRVQQRISTSVGTTIFRRFAVDFFDHVQRLDLAFFGDTKMGEFLHRLGQDTYHIYRMILNGIVVTATNAGIVIALLVYGFILNPLLAVVILLIVPVYVLTQRFAGRLTRETTEAMVRDWSNVASFQSEKLGGVRLVQELRAEGAMRSEYDRLNAVAGESFRNQELAVNLGQLLLNLSVYVGPMLVIALGGYMTIRGAMSLGTMLAFFYFSGRLFAPVSGIVQQYLAIQRANVGVRRIYEFLDRPSAIEEPANPLPLPSGSLSVEFDAVSFTYGRAPVFRELTLRVEAGETVGIVGASGAGKSTIANLVYRFWDAQSGGVRIGGVDVRRVSLDGLRSRLGIVSQDTVLFHDSVIGNLRVAKPEAGHDEMVQACRTAGIHTFVCSLPDGYDTVVGERGVKLSGGQRQRISIARAVLRNPDILLLDEATSHLDSETEEKVQAALDRIAQGRTSIIIAHRLSTLSACDRLIVIDDGRVSESGTHEELLAHGGLYRTLWMRQVQGA